MKRQFLIISVSAASVLAIRMKRTTVHHLSFAVAVATMFVTSASLRASEADNQVESSFTNTYVYRTYLRDDAVRAEAKDGVVTLTGIAKTDAERSLVNSIAASIRGVIGVKNQMTVEHEPRTK